MTPEEKAVVQAAISMHKIGRVPTRQEENALRTIVHKLIFACPDCNAGGHTCPGDGNSIGHGDFSCGEHGENPNVVTPDFDPEARRNADKRHPCLECLDPNEDPRSWCDCGGNTDRFGECAYPCVARAHQPEDCRNVPPRWVLTEWQHVASGDRVRLGTSEAEVTQATRFDGHTKVDSWRDRNTGKMRDNVTGRWDHTEIRIRLAHLPNVLEFPPAGPVEVLMDAGRRAEYAARIGLEGEVIGRE